VEGFGVNLAFWTLSVLTLGSAGGVMAVRSLFHAVLFLIVSFVGVAGFFVLLSAEFLAMAQIIIYVGAIAVLLLFAVLLTPRADRNNAETSMAAPAVLLAIAVATVVIFVIHDTNWATVAANPELTGAELGDALLGTWVLPFQVASVLLTAALVGAIMLIRSPEEEAEDER
jgi:NADH-quinone oxidoreductase subunit J